MAIAFSPEGEGRFQDLLRRYPERQAALIPVLHLAIREFGWLSREAMEYVATRLGVPTFVFGPDGENYHTRDEFVYVDSAVATARVIYRFLERLLVRP